MIFWGKQIDQKPWNHIDESALKAAAAKFTGAIMQRPPNYSAISIDGVRMYDLALKGKKMPEIPERPVTIYKLDMMQVDLPDFEFKMLCSGGTYVRSFVRDLSCSLGTVATMTSLLSTIQGKFELKDCMSIEETDNIDLLRERLSQSRRKFIYGK
jgi:tRNA pseudouridine55 synthase